MIMVIWHLIDISYIYKYWLKNKKCNVSTFTITAHLINKTLIQKRLTFSFLSKSFYIYRKGIIGRFLLLSVPAGGGGAGPQEEDNCGPTGARQSSRWGRRRSGPVCTPPCPRWRQGERSVAAAAAPSTPAGGWSTKELQGTGREYKSRRTNRKQETRRRQARAQKRSRRNNYGTRRKQRRTRRKWGWNQENMREKRRRRGEK